MLHLLSLIALVTSSTALAGDAEITLKLATVSVHRAIASESTVQIDLSGLETTGTLPDEIGARVFTPEVALTGIVPDDIGIQAVVKPSGLGRLDNLWLCDRKGCVELTFSDAELFEGDAGEWSADVWWTVTSVR